ncbi:MAG: hypothetical protein KA129_05695 [Microthrixaceae bacterium]|nr:hypothetical protein [Microthrixaceae bacterium]
MTFRITTTPLIDVEIDDVPVQFFGDPPDTALLELFKVQDQFGGSTADTLEALMSLRAALRGLVPTSSHGAWDDLVHSGKITLGTTMTLFEHLSAKYGEALGFRGGQRATSGAGLPASAATSEGSSPAVAPV